MSESFTQLIHSNTLNYSETIAATVCHMGMQNG